MSTTTSQHDSTAHTAAEHDHPSDVFYVKIALALAAITALEVSTYWQDFGALFLPVLLVLMAVKFVMVVLFFMHLRYDAKVFGQLFWSGLGLALGVYLVTLTAFHFWGT